MNIFVLFKVNGLLLLLFSTLITIPLSLAISDGEDISPWLYTLGACISLGLLGFTIGRKSNAQRDLNIKEGVASTTLFWTLTSLTSALAIWLSIPEVNFLQAWFESMSGLTTTGSSIFGGYINADGEQAGVSIESLPPSILLWRAMLQWVGGIGIIVISIALMPLIMGASGFQLYRAELPGLTADRLTPRLTSSAKILLGTYIGLSVLIAIALMLCGTDPFDAACHAMTTISTGGYSTLDDSVEGLKSNAAEWVIILGMFIAALNFTLLIQCIRGKSLSIWRNTETRTFIIFTFTAWVLIVFTLHRQSQIYHNHPHDLIRDSLFQVVSIISSTGFGSGYDSCPESWAAWPQTCILILIVCMICGGCAGSTAGGMKIIRVIVLFKCIKGELRRHMEPKRVTSIQLNNQPLPQRVVTQVYAFLILFCLSLIFGTLAFCWLGHPIDTSFSATLTALSNIGPGLGEIGPSMNFGAFDRPSLLLSIFLMLLGRLELMTVLVTLNPYNWRR